MGKKKLLDNYYEHFYPEITFKRATTIFLYFYRIDQHRIFTLSLMLMPLHYDFDYNLRPT